ncbi:hypothetical protein, partial [Paraburkholderia elongata]|uniref:hypothetical protein n=1 Tax=Paraburkholderia elongata TaxID=2675747 RepID=UPI001C12F8D3
RFITFAIPGGNVVRGVLPVMAIVVVSISVAQVYLITLARQSPHDGLRSQVSGTMMSRKYQRGTVLR